MEESHISYFKSKARKAESWDRSKARPCVPNSQVANAKEKFLKQIKGASPVNTWMVRKKNSFIADIEKDLVLWVEDQTSHNIPLTKA